MLIRNFQFLSSLWRFECDLVSPSWTANDRRKLFDRFARRVPFLSDCLFREWMNCRKASHERKKRAAATRRGRKLLCLNWIAKLAAKTFSFSVWCDSRSSSFEDIKPSGDFKLMFTSQRCLHFASLPAVCSQFSDWARSTVDCDCDKHPEKKKVFMLLLWPAFCARANKKDCLSLSSMFVLLLPIPGAIKAVAGNELAADNLQVRPGREMRLNRIGVWVDGARYSSMWKSMIPFVIRYCTRFCLAFFRAIAMVIFVDSFQFQFLFAQLVCESIIKNYDEWSALDSCLLIFDLSFATRKPLIYRGK